MASIRLATLALTFFVSAGFSAQGQIDPTAYKTAEIAVFGGYFHADPAYASSHNANGASLGVNYTRYFHFPVAPSIEVRANAANGSLVNEKSYLVGLRGVGRSSGRYHPYLEALAGKGTIHFNGNNNGYLGDESAVFDLGGGLDLDVTRSFQFKADVQAQRWHLGGPNKFYPVGVLVGVTYRIPFKPHVSQRDLH
jgi:hypothetical protein